MPNQYTKTAISLSEKLFSKVDKSAGLGPAGDCWLWTGAIRGRMAKSKGVGYGVFRHNGKTYSAHRASYELAHGAIETGLGILHSCDNPRCVNPSHLRAGSNTENLAEMVAKGRNWQQQKTHCKRGHEFTPENTFTKSARGKRQCIICMKSTSRERYVSKRTAMGLTPAPEGANWRKLNFLGREAALSARAQLGVVADGDTPAEPQAK